MAIGIVEIWEAFLLVDPTIDVIGGIGRLWCNLLGCGKRFEVSRVLYYHEYGSCGLVNADML